MLFMPTVRLSLQHTAVLMVDMQEKLLGHMHNAEALTGRVGVLLGAAKALALPLLVTEQYPKGLGGTVAGLAGYLGGAVCRQEKVKFSACVEPVRDALVRHGVRCVVVCGIEAHVCILQTCLDLADSGFLVGVAVDAIGSRKRVDQDAAVLRMTQSGVVATTVESAILEIVHEAGGSRFKAVLPLIKSP